MSDSKGFRGLVGLRWSQNVSGWFQEVSGYFKGCEMRSRGSQGHFVTILWRFKGSHQVPKVFRAASRGFKGSHRRFRESGAFRGVPRGLRDILRSFRGVSGGLTGP